MKYILFLCVFLFLSEVAIAYDCGQDNVDPVDDPNNIVRPCIDFDVDCIRDYFYGNSRCERTQGPVPDPLLLKYYKVDIPHSNMSAELRNIHVEGLNGDIVEFYFNTVTDALVLAIEVYDLKLSTQEKVIKYYRKGKEPVLRYGSVEYKYDKATLTAIFRNKSKLDLREADISTYVDDAAPDMKISPSFSSDLDPKSRKQYEEFINDFSTTIKEVFIRQGNIFMASYIQHNICDFKLKLPLY